MGINLIDDETNSEAPTGYRGPLQQHFWTPSYAQPKHRPPKNAKHSLARTLGLAAMLHDIGPVCSLKTRKFTWAEARDQVEPDLVTLVQRSLRHQDAPEVSDLQYRVESSRFVSQLYQTLRDKGERSAIRLVYGHLYNLRMAEDFPIIDRILDDVEVQRLAPSVLVSLLTITAPSKKYLDNRATFYDRSKRVIEQLRGPQAAARILIGLE